MQHWANDNKDRGTLAWWTRQAACYVPFTTKEQHERDAARVGQYAFDNAPCGIWHAAFVTLPRAAGEVCPCSKCCASRGEKLVGGVRTFAKKGVA